MKMNGPENLVPDVDQMMEGVGEVVKKVEEIPKEKVDKIEQTGEKLINQSTGMAMGAIDRFEKSGDKMMGMMDDFLAGESGEKQTDKVKTNSEVQSNAGVDESGGENYNQSYDSGYGNEAPVATDNMYANMSDEEREKWNSMTPEQQEQAMNAYNNLPPEKQEEIANMTPDERKAALMEQQGGGNEEPKQSDEWQAEGTGETTGAGASSVENTEGRQTATGTGAAQKGGSRG